MKVVIIGAGPGGLVACKTLLGARTPDFPFDPIVLEQEDGVGGTFRYRSYENANLVSSKYLTSFSDFRLPTDAPDHLTLHAYCDYLSAYAVAFGVMERVKFCSRVVRISKSPAGGHLVSYVRKPIGSDNWDTEPITIHTPYVVVCTGLHVTPSIPDIPGMQHVLEPSTPREKGSPKPEVFHSIHYKSRAQLAGRRVMVLGTGETGSDVAYNAAKAGAKEVVLCSRVGFLHVPKALTGLKIMGITFAPARPLPIDTWTTNLAGTAYVHPWVAASRFRWILSDKVISRLSWLLTGSSFGCNQLIGGREIENVGRTYVHFNKSPKVLPYINRPYRNKWRDFICSYVEPEEDSAPATDFVVDLAPFPSKVLPSGRVVFPVSAARKDSLRMAGRDFRPDTVVFATGYTQKFGFLDKEYAIPGELEMRNVANPDDPTIGFVGFLRPGLGAIPPIAEVQSMLWVQLIKGELQLPLSAPHYELLADEEYRIKYGVDHSAYISTLARDIGAAPGLWELWWEHGTKVLLCYCLGAAYMPFYRLVGPFRDEKAPEIVRTELWETITRRGIPGLVLGSLLPMAFYGIVNICAWVLEAALRPVGLVSMS